MTDINVKVLQCVSEKPKRWQAMKGLHHFSTHYGQAARREHTFFFFLAAPIWGQIKGARCRSTVPEGRNLRCKMDAATGAQIENNN